MRHTICDEIFVYAVSPTGDPYKHTGSKYNDRTYIGPICYLAYVALLAGTSVWVKSVQQFLAMGMNSSLTWLPYQITTQAIK